MWFDQSDVTGCLFSYCLIFCCVWYLLPIFVFKDFLVENAVVFLFSLVMTFTCSMFELVIFEITGSWDPNFRYFVWLVDLYSLVILTLFIIPLYLFYFIANTSSVLQKCSKIFTLSCHIIFLSLFYFLGGFPIVIDGDDGTFFSLEEIIGRIGVVGVCFIAGLSGFCAVNAPYTWLWFFLQDVDNDNIAEFELKVTHAIEQEFSYKRRLLDAQRRRDKEWNEVGTIKRIFRILKSFCGARDEVQELEDQLDAATSLRHDLFDHLKFLYDNKFALEKSQKLLGRLKNCLGYIMAIVCIWKIFMSSINVIFNREKRFDPITNIFRLMALHLKIEFDKELVHLISQFGSFAFIGILCVTQIRGFMVNVIMKVFRRLSSLFTSNVIMLILTELTAMYFISYLLLMRMNLPAEYRQMVTLVLGKLEFHFYHQWFDFIFCISSMTTIMCFIVSEGYSKLSKEKLG